MDVKLKYGKGEISFSIEEKRCAGILRPNGTALGLTGEAELRRALLNPTGCGRLRDIVGEGERVAVITSDITRPTPSALLLPHVIKELKAGGVRGGDIRIVLALGSHRGHTEAEKRSIVGDDVYENFRVLDSDVNDCVRLGVCANGTPADVFRPVAEADRRVCLGNVEYHYFAGYSGGCKAVMPGVSSREAIQKNHSNMVREGAFAGNMDTNPVRSDIDEIRRFVSVDFIVNVVLDDSGRIVKAAAGDAELAHREACAALDAMYKIPIPERAEVVVISPGGFPKDINIYQAQKALDNARHAVKRGGVIVWCASASEGFGEETFEAWMRTKRPADMVEAIQKDFRLGGHKAAAIAIVLAGARVFMVSDLPADLVRSIHMTPFDTAQEAVDAALDQMGEDAKLLVMPAAGSTLPVARDSFSVGSLK
jgi:nickel-dependent lactate racemase